MPPCCEARGTGAPGVVPAYSWLYRRCERLHLDLYGRMLLCRVRVRVLLLWTIDIAWSCGGSRCAARSKMRGAVVLCIIDRPVTVGRMFKPG